MSKSSPRIAATAASGVTTLARLVQRKAYSINVYVEDNLA
jgi:hypothetical protein